MNSLHSITLYRLSPYVWGFDDKPNGIVAEPFVGNTNAMLDTLLENCKAKGTTLIFGDFPFPNAHSFDWISGDEHGNWYKYDGIQGWLCPTLLVYFEKPPRNIYIIAT